MPSFTPARTARRTRLEVSLDVVLERRDGLRSEAVLVSRVDVVAIVIDRRHPHRAAAHHLRERVVIQIDAVLDRVGAGTHGVANARGAVRVNRHWPPGRVRRLDNGLHLVERDGLRRLHALEASARPIHLHPVGRRLQTLGRRRAHGVRAGRAAAARRDALARRRTCAGPSSRPMAMRSRIARSMSFDAPRSRTVVTPVSSVARALSWARNTVTAGLRRWPSGRGAGLPIPVVGHVGVQVDEAGQAGPRREVDHTRARRHRFGGPAHRHEAVAPNDDHRRTQRAGSRPESAEADGYRFGLSGRGCRRHEHDPQKDGDGGEVQTRHGCPVCSTKHPRAGHRRRRGDPT